MEEEEVQAALAAGASAAPAADGEAGQPAVPAPRRALGQRAGSAPLSGSILDRGAWTSLVQELRERTVRR